MPTTEPASSGELPSEDLVLAAIERAQRHQRGQARGVILSTLIEHLDLPRGSATSRRLRPKLDALIVGGTVQESTRRSITAWTITEQGRRQLDAVRRAGDLSDLPEAPQHREWRRARAAATERIDDFRLELSTALDAARALLDAASPAATSEDWFVVCDQLREASWRLGSATYCLCEWPEPSDAVADIEPPTQHHRRDFHSWA